jgi:hypothetical protein
MFLTLRMRHLIGSDPKVMMDVIFNSVGKDVSSSVLMCKKNATITLEFATIKDTEIQKVINNTCGLNTDNTIP